MIGFCLVNFGCFDCFSHVACNPLKDPLLLEDMVRSLLDLGGCWERNFSNSLLLMISVAEGLSVGSNETSQSTNLYWKKKSLPGNIVKILHKFGFFNSIIIIKKCDYLLICKFVFLWAYFKITWFHCFVSNCKNCKYAKYFTVHNMYSSDKSEILKSTRNGFCNFMWLFIPRFWLGNYTK